VLVSIIIPAFNEERLLGGTLEHVKAAATVFDAHNWRTEIIVCDNNSTDRTAELARAFGAQVVFEPLNQIARARNRGASVARGDWLIFVDADSKPGKKLFGDVAAAIKGGRCLAGGSTVAIDENSAIGLAAVTLWNSLSRVFRLLAGSFIFCETTLFREVGGFSSELFAGEELDLTQKLKRAARMRGKGLVILSRNPLLTSARKMHLYSLREHLSFFLRASVRPNTMLRSREACHTWYDGRR
jgi:glycosyltransferase involved in cell wall biosynthesis